MSDGSSFGGRRWPQRRRRTEPPATVFPTFDEIAARAYELFVAGGRRVDHVFEYWSRAETELLDRAVRRATR